LFAFHPEVWMNDPSDIASRMAMMEVMLEYADTGMRALSLADAYALKAKFVDVTKAILADDGVSIETATETLKSYLQDRGITFEVASNAPAVDG
jgi:hypothetical protein